LGARDILLCVERGQKALLGALHGAVASRQDLDGFEVHLVETPSGYLSGEESALVHFLDGGEAKPTSVPPRPFERGVGGRPTLVDNVETLANIALIVRYGPAWFRSMGTESEPGTRLFTIGGAGRHTGVYEAPIGSRLVDLFQIAGERIDNVEAVLVGGYYGTWLAPYQFATLNSSDESLRIVGSSPGCGVLRALPPWSCAVSEVARVTAWLSSQTARQCGPCTNGMPALAAQMAALNAGGWDGEVALGSLHHLLAILDGRGACHLPDGAVQFVASAVRALGPHIDHHRRYGPCRATRAVLPTPPRGSWR
jgi:NADH:ubiquinone oxidoreductase subunit F (NADH-binding)